MSFLKERNPKQARDKISFDDMAEHYLGALFKREFVSMAELSVCSLDFRQFVACMFSLTRDSGGEVSDLIAHLFTKRATIWKEVISEGSLESEVEAFCHANFRAFVNHVGEITIEPNVHPYFETIPPGGKS